MTHSQYNIDPKIRNTTSPNFTEILRTHTGCKCAKMFIRNNGLKTTRSLYHDKAPKQQQPNAALTLFSTLVFHLWHNAGLGALKIMGNFDALVCHGALFPICLF